MGLSWYQCKSCSTTIKKDSTPNNSGCPSKVFHTWTKLGDVGETNYQCKKCGTTVQTKSTPSNSGCNGAPFHSWTKL